MKILRAADYFRAPGGFPLRVLRIADHGDAVDPHGHDFYELVVVLSGRGLHETETEKYEIAGGDVFLVEEGVAHSYRSSHELALINILFHPAQLHLRWDDLKDLPGYHALFHIEPRLRREDGFSSRLRLSEDQLARTLELIARIEDELEQTRGGYRFMATSDLMQLICYLSRRYAGMELARERPVMQLGDVLSFVEQHYDEHITVARLAEIAHMSETSLVRIFKKALDRPPMDFVIRTRIAKAKVMLARDDQTITDIALACGFNDSNYFSRRFRKVAGQSPRAFRTKQRH